MVPVKDRFNEMSEVYKLITHIQKETHNGDVWVEIEHGANILPYTRPGQRGGRQATPGVRFVALDSPEAVTFLATRRGIYVYDEQGA